MTDEERKVEYVERHHKECCCMLFCKFLMITSAVFVGTLLALLVAKALMHPKFPPCPCMMKHYRPGFERQIPPPPHMMKDNHKHDFRGERPNFDKDRIHNKPEKKN